jgi:hypothetical protein
MVFSNPIKNKFQVRIKEGVARNAQKRRSKMVTGVQKQKAL